MEKKDKYWIDENNNRWSVSFYTEEQAILASKSLENCKDCLDCTKCINCIACLHCDGCSHCESCRYCCNCYHCEFCNNCGGCTYCEKLSFERQKDHYDNTKTQWVKTFCNKALPIITAVLLTVLICQRI